LSDMTSTFFDSGCPLWIRSGKAQSEQMMSAFGAKRTCSAA
jgi:hypothetical protein